MKKKTVGNVGYQIIRPLLKVFIVLVMWPKAINKENIPKKGGCILAGNHLSNYDPILVGNATLRSVHFLGKKELFEIPVIGGLFRFFGVIKVDRSTKNPLARQEAVNALNEGNLVALFPEGHRNKTKDLLMPFKFGAVSFAEKTGLPIIPFAIIGKPKTFHYRHKIVFGEPFYVPKESNLEEKTNELREIISKIYLENIK